MLQQKFVTSLFKFRFSNRRQDTRALFELEVTSGPDKSQSGNGKVKFRKVANGQVDYNPHRYNNYLEHIYFKKDFSDNPKAFI